MLYTLLHVFLLFWKLLLVVMPLLMKVKAIIPNKYDNRAMTILAREPAVELINDGYKCFDLINIFYCKKLIIFSKK